MRDKLQIPSEAVPYILYQRTNYLQFSNSFIYRISHRVFPNASYKFLVTLESRLFKKRVMDRYAESMLNEYRNIKEYLPINCNSVLDIGCGVAGIDPYIARHYQFPLHFFLLDKTKTDQKILYEYRPFASFYNSLLIAQKLMTMNGIHNEKVTLLEANDNHTIIVDTKMDLVISLLAWGFHFPVNTYLDQVYSIMSKSGTLIMDVSAETDGLVILTRKFSSVEIIREKPNHIRIVAKK